MILADFLLANGLLRRQPISTMPGRPQRKTNAAGVW